MNPFTERIEKFKKLASIHEKQSFLFSTLRGICFVIAILLFIQFFRSDEWIYLIGAVAGFALFSYLISRHQHHTNLFNYYEMLVVVNKEETKRTNLDLSGFDQGKEFIIPNHHNQEDLDLLGQHSVFQLVNHCALEDSKKLLARWLSETPNSSEILERQTSVKELSDKLDWIQDFQSHARIAVNKKKKQEPVASASDLLKWAGIPTTLTNPILYKATGITLCLICVGLIAIIAMGGFPYQYIYGSLLVNAIFLALIFNKLNRQIKGINEAKYIISSYQQCIQLVTEENFTAHRSATLKATLTKPISALQGISELSQLTHSINSRSNMLYALLDIVFILDVHLLLRIEKWKTTYQKHLEQWLNAIHEFEALVSIGTFAHSHSNYSFPEIIDEPFKLGGQKIGHPLIPSHQRVPNDYFIEGKGSVDIITGSNMSGKSTFQRTLGVNMILGNIGAPVCAEKFEMNPVEVFTSMRTKDNLEENTSSFYAELKRIRQLLDLVKEKRVFFLLDEILKGTNSEDRHLGAVALAKKLNEEQAFGLISTHDLTLGKLEESQKGVRNFSFNSEITGNKINFDYKLTYGPCRSFNASQLMKNLGVID